MYLLAVLTDWLTYFISHRESPEVMVELFVAYISHKSMSTVTTTTTMMMATTTCDLYKPHPCSSVRSSQSATPSQRRTHSRLVVQSVRRLLVLHGQSRSSVKSGQSNVPSQRRLTSTHGRPLHENCWPLHATTTHRHTSIDRLAMTLPRQFTVAGCHRRVTGSSVDREIGWLGGWGSGAKPPEAKYTDTVYS